MSEYMDSAAAALIRDGWAITRSRAVERSGPCNWRPSSYRCNQGVSEYLFGGGTGWKPQEFRVGGGTACPKCKGVGEIRWTETVVETYDPRVGPWSVS